MSLRAFFDGGNTKNFNPDFLVWVPNAIIAIDTKGDHLIHVDSVRKLFNIRKVRNGILLIVGESVPVI